jgi:hypothetical protein
LLLHLLHLALYPEKSALDGTATVTLSVPVVLESFATQLCQFQNELCNAQNQLQALHDGSFDYHASSCLVLGVGPWRFFPCDIRLKSFAKKRVNSTVYLVIIHL